MSKLELKTFVNATMALTNLAKQRLPLKYAYKLRKIIEAVNDELAFFAEERAKIIGKVEWDKATLDEKNKINDQIEKLLAFEVNWMEVPMMLPMDLNIEMSASDLELMKDFVQIKEEE